MERSSVGEQLGALTRRLSEELWTEGRLELVDELIADDYRGHVAVLGEIRGPEGIRELVELYRSAFPDLRVTVDDLLVAGDTAVTRWRAEGTHEGELMGLAPTGRRVTGTGITIDRWEAGKAIESWSESNQLEQLQQLGVMPRPGSFGDRVGKGLQRMTVRARGLLERFPGTRASAGENGRG